MLICLDHARRVRDGDRVDPLIGLTHIRSGHRLRRRVYGPCGAVRATRDQGGSVCRPLEREDPSRHGLDGPSRRNSGRGIPKADLTAATSSGERGSIRTEGDCPGREHRRIDRVARAVFAWRIHRHVAVGQIAACHRDPGAGRVHGDGQHGTRDDQGRPDRITGMSVPGPHQSVVATSQHARRVG
jgi:hypothetical protein